MKKFTRIVFVLAILIVGLWLFKYTSPNLRIEGYSGLFWELLFPVGETEYAQNYSHQKFLKIKIGMTEKEVVSILGEPLVKWDPGENKVGFQYSNSPASTHYRLRQVYFLNHRVSDVIGYYYVD